MPISTSALNAIRKLFMRQSPTAAEQAALAEARAAAPEKKMLQGVYRGYAGADESPVVHYHGGTYVPGEETTKPLYMTRDREMAQSYVDAKGGRLVALSPTPRKVAPQRDLDELARKYVPENEYYGYTPASALDSYLHDSKGVGRIINELWNREFDHVRAFDVGFGSPGGEVLIALPGENVMSAPTSPVFISPQKRVADYYAKKRAAQVGADPHVEMLLVDPNSGRAYTHATGGRPDLGYPEPMVTRARKLKPEDVKERSQLYARGGLAKLKECSCGHK